MEVFLKSLIPTNLYIKWFNPKEDTEQGINVYLHIKDNSNNTTYSLKLKKNVTRYDVVAFLKQIHELHHQSQNNSSSSLNDLIDENNNENEDNNILENNDILKQECSCLFEFYNEKELITALNKMKIFTKNKFIFLGESSISVSHEQDEENKLWYTHFYKIHNLGKKEETECIACICNKYSYIFEEN